MEHHDEGDTSFHLQGLPASPAGDPLSDVLHFGAGLEPAALHDHTTLLQIQGKAGFRSEVQEIP